MDAYQKALGAKDWKKVIELARETNPEQDKQNLLNSKKLEQFGDPNESRIIWIEEKQEFLKKQPRKSYAHPLPVGTRVRKFSGKKFKSGEKVNTVKGYAPHPVLGKDSYTFEEDDSVMIFDTVIPEGD